MRRIFISATSGDLGSYRRAVRDVLLSKEILPLVQDHFSPDYRSVVEMLEEKIRQCDAMICLVGFVYGQEPRHRPADEPRRSYTQLEYVIARRLGKPVYRFLAREDCAFDTQVEEAEELRQLQLAYRAELRQSDLMRSAFSSVADLQAHIYAISFLVSITASATPMPAVPGKSTAAPAEKDVAGLSQTVNSLDRSVSRYDFFIAYATPDRRQAQDLCWFLQDDSCEVFLDVKDLRPGTLWPPALREALEASHTIVVLVSTHTDDAFYQQEEIVRAIQLARDKPRAHTVIPVILEKLPHGAVSMPYGLSSRQGLDATRAGGLKRVAAELVGWLNDHQLDAK